jgi:hypothetical protein
VAGQALRTKPLINDYHWVCRKQVRSLSAELATPINVGQRSFAAGLAT